MNTKREYFDFQEFKRDFSAICEQPVKKYAVIGYPAKHSMSPKLHHSMTGGIRYSLLEISRDKLGEFCDFARCNLHGFNVTVPYKKEIIKYLDKVDSLAESLGSVNTVKAENGKLYGYNTDVYGITKAIESEIKIGQIKKALVLGAGGAAVSAVYALLAMGAEVTVAARDTGKAAAAINFPCSFADIKEVGGAFDIVVNCTPCGMLGQEDTAAIDLSKISGCTLYYDMVYNPLKTKQMSQAISLGIPAVNGLSMLIHQGREAQRIWGNRKFKAAPDRLRDLLSYEVFLQRLKNLHKKTAVALCGFMASGKSTAAKVLSSRYGIHIVDTDLLIEKKFGMAVGEIFKSMGEQRFRQAETDALTELPYTFPSLVSLGGGTVQSASNVEIIKRSCILVFIDITLPTALTRASRRDTRPLLKKSEQEIKALYNQRRQLYQTVCDAAVDGEQPIDKVVKAIIESI